MSQSQRVTENGSSSITRTTDSGRFWSITINNPTEDDIQKYQTLATLHWVQDVAGQIEIGKEGTRHIQAMLTTKKVRFSQVKKALPRAHIEIARSPQALAKYVQKEETRVESMPNQHNTTKIATQFDLQKKLYSLCLLMIQTHHFKPRYHKFLGITWYFWWESRDKILSEEEAREELTSRLNFDDAYSLMLEEDGQKLIDIAVQSIIEANLYGIEFVMSNNINKNGFKNYLRSILYRYGVSQTNSSQSTQIIPSDTDSTEN